MTKKTKNVALKAADDTARLVDEAERQGKKPHAGQFKKGEAHPCYRHGHNICGKRSPTYNSWRAMMGRCYHPSNSSYHLYGAAGVTVCERWRESFANFLEDMGERPPGTTLNRINGSNIYGPGLAEWAVKDVQQDQRSCTVWITHDGETLSLRGWAEVVGISRRTLQNRLRSGWSPERALSEPVDVRFVRSPRKSPK